MVLLLVDVRLNEDDVLTVSRELPFRPFLLDDFEFVFLSGLSSPESAVVVCVSESDVLALL